MSQASETHAVVSIFELTNTRGYFCPRLRVEYRERSGVTAWQINAGGTRCYIAHTELSEPVESMDTEAAASHFMMSRVIAALLISGSGLFTPTPKGRIRFTAPDKFSWAGVLNMEFYSADIDRAHSEFSEVAFSGWLHAICEHAFLRRAIDDLAIALAQPVEAIVYISRGFEWIKTGLPCSPDVLAAALGVSTKHLKELGRLANEGTGVRHANSLGKKLVADPTTYASWSAGLIDAINFARHRKDPSFTPMQHKEVAKLVGISAQLTPYA